MLMIEPMLSFSLNNDETGTYDFLKIKYQITAYIYIYIYIYIYLNNFKQNIH